MKLKDKISNHLLLFVCGSANDIVIPNYYLGFYEADLLRITKSGFIIEYEIKISRSDYFADFKKGIGLYNRPFEKKHDQLAAAKLDINRFFFVVPENMIKEEEVPEHAGLIYYNTDRGVMSIVKHAKLIHKRKKIEEPSFYETLARSLAFRCLNKERKIFYLSRKIDE